MNQYGPPNKLRAAMETIITDYRRDTTTTKSSLQRYGCMFGDIGRAILQCHCLTLIIIWIIHINDWGEV